MTSSRVLLSVQPFGLADLGGGQQILRTLFDQAPMKVFVCNTNPGAKAAVGEFRIPRRMFFGRLERTRFGHLFEYLTKPSTPLFLERLEHLIQQLGITDIHSVSHDVEFAHAFDVSQKLNLPFHLSIHDDARYVNKGRSFADYALSKLAEAWLKANSVFVVSTEMGEEYCRRYGNRKYQLVTDGIDQIAKETCKHRPNRLSIYFMGLFHYGYRENLMLLLRALDALHDKNPQAQFTVKIRCGKLNHIDFSKYKTAVTVLDATLDSALLSAEMADADLLYLPLQFGSAFEDFTRLSLSTKLVSYSATGVPILYHGPEFAAAGRLLERHAAALMVPSMDQDLMERVLQQALTSGAENEARSALAMAHARFRKEVSRSTFWTQILSVTDVQRPEPLGVEQLPDLH